MLLILGLASVGSPTGATRPLKIISQTGKQAAETVSVMQTHGILTTPAPVTVTILGGKSPERFSGRMLSSDTKTMKIDAPQGVTAGTALRIDVEGGLVLGEVISSTTDGKTHMVAIAVQHVIPSVASLANLVSAVMGYKRAVENVEAPAAAAYSTQPSR